jgi:ADP-ribose pyrophosphatase YjhB (NUDIX family)
MLAARLLAEYQRRHDARDWAALSALFGPDGELRFHRLPVSGARGADAIERLFRAHPPADALVVGGAAAQPGGAVAAAYGWRSAPELVAGELRLQPEGDHIGRLDVFALPVAKRPRERQAVRALLVAPDPAILLFRCGEPGREDTWWICPGGGVDPGEDEHEALRRELREEVGLDATIGPALWTRAHTFTWKDDVLRQRERYYLVRVPDRVEPAPLAADEGHRGHRWWTPDELAATDEILVPRRLAEYVRAVLRHGPAATPFDAGV